ncbi:imidazole glycerol phosphate synthase subunit HisH [Paludicola sp. MB14-C6]|uniref:imidazole glycerol phosphate synthase subunit HisH n=1 Tax=Paludihabitans sp. MB14-C6 TaxID=3070656 RepID=UPI0027DC8A7A|nr:imidazole glycerol phosphate synthase subunit HisH [Paludicola sp. MB14-C6]WMJ23629.1 imidazole glycerol phosphate synthase subunit HisH [Paludicola sp. MB14-C6]
MIAIIDYGAGNLFSVKNAFDYIGKESKITKDKSDIQKAEALILPGVGAFPKAMQMLQETDLISTIKEEIQKKPLLGICLGMQMLFEEGYEFERTNGLGFIDGCIKYIQTDYKIPHMGYNELEFHEPSPLLNGIQSGDCVYFVHSYMAHTSSHNVAAYCDYGIKVPALVQKGNVFGAQFHPEKSGEVGLQILKNFASL